MYSRKESEPKEIIKEKDYIAALNEVLSKYKETLERLTYR